MFPPAGHEDPKNPEYNRYNNYNYHYYQYYAAKEEKMKKELNMLNMYDYLDDLGVQVDGLVKPDGSPEFPAHSCKDIQMCFPQAESGKIS